MRPQKLEITQGLLNQLPAEGRESIDQAMLSWWVNIRDDGGLRLTYHGYSLLNTVFGIESWTVDITKVLTKRVILDLDRKLDWPYYIDIKKKKIVFFSGREAMMATLYGDIAVWLNNYS